MNEIYRHFDSIAEYSALRSNPENDWTGWNADQGSRSWYGVNSRAEALAICKAGVWPEGLARMERELAGFEAPVATCIRRQGVWSDQGDSLDIHRVNSGQLDTSWRRTRRIARQSSSNVVIAFPLMIAAAMNADKLFWCGAAALKLADVLTVAGYSVTLIGIHGTENAGHRSHDSLIVKAASAPMDVASLIVAVAFPGFARTVGFKAIASNPFPVTSGLGKAIYDDPAPLNALNLPKGNVIQGLFSSVESRESARQWIANELARLDQQGEEAA